MADLRLVELHNSSKFLLTEKAKEVCGCCKKAIEIHGGLCPWQSIDGAFCDEVRIIDEQFASLNYSFNDWLKERRKNGRENKRDC